jgi:hypothetical protein
MNYAGRVEMLNSAVQSANKHAQNIANVVKDPGASKQQVATGILNSVGGAVGSTAGVVSGVQHFRDMKRMGQNIFNRLNGQVNTNSGIKSANPTNISGGGNDSGGANEQSQNTANPNSTPNSNANADNLGGGNARNTAGDSTQSAPQSARTNINEPSTKPANAADDDIEGMSWDDLVKSFGNLDADRGALSNATDAFVNNIGLGSMDSHEVPSGTGNPDAAADALDQVTNNIKNNAGGMTDGADVQNLAGQTQDAANATLDASKIAQNGGGGATQTGGDAANLVSKATSGAEEGLTAATDTAAAVADTGDAIMAGSAASGVAAPIVAVVGGLVSLGATIASAFEKKPKAKSPPPPPTSNQNQGAQMGGNLRQDQGDSGVGLY